MFPIFGLHTSIGYSAGRKTYSKVITKYTITSRPAHTTQAPKNWTLQGSNNDSAWTTLDTRTNETAWGAAEKRTYTFTNTTAYRYYKLDVTAINGSTDGLSISEMELIVNGTTDEVPLMTSATTPAPCIISYSTFYTITYEGWRAFDKTTATFWLTKNTVVTGWLKVNFGSYSYKTTTSTSMSTSSTSSSSSTSTTISTSSTSESTSTTTSV